MQRPLYTHHAVELLLVGPPSSGKRTLARQILQCRDTFFSINVAEDFEGNALDRAGRMDFIFCLVDMTNKNSLDTLQVALGRMKTNYILTKAAVVITKMDLTRLWAMNIATVHDLVKGFADLQLFHVNLEDGRERRVVSDQLARLVRVSVLQQRDVHPLLLRTRKACQGSTEGCGDEHTEQGRRPHRSHSLSDVESTT